MKIISTLKKIVILAFLSSLIFSMPVFSDNEETEAEEIARRMRELTLDEDDELATAEADYQTATTENDDAEAFMNLAIRIDDIVRASWFDYTATDNARDEITRILATGSAAEQQYIGQISTEMEARLARGERIGAATEAIRRAAFMQAVNTQMHFEAAMHARDDVEIRRDDARAQAEQNITIQVRERRIQAQMARERELSRLQIEREQLLRQQYEGARTRLEQINKIIDSMEQGYDQSPSELDKIKAIVDYGPTVEGIIKHKKREDDEL